MQRDDAGYGRLQRGGNLRIAHIRKVFRAVHLQIVDLCVVCATHKSGSAAKINRQSARLNSVNGESVQSQPSRDGIDIFLGNAVVLGELIGGEPLVKVRRWGVVQFVDVLLQRRLPLGRSFQLDQHVIQWKVVRNNT